MNEKPQEFIGKEVIYNCNHFSPPSFDRGDETEAERSWNRVRRAVPDSARYSYD